MLSNIILEGQKIEIQLINVKKGEAKKAEKLYVSQVSDIIDEETLEITMPIEKTKIILLEPDIDYNLFFYTKNGVYHARGTIVARYKTGTLYLLKIKLLTTIVKHQRREYFRYSCVIDFQSRKVTEREAIKLDLEDLKLGEKELLQGLVVDISGGGLKIVVKKYYDEGDLCICEVPLNIGGNVQEITFVGKILTSKLLDDEMKNFEHTIQFEEINSNDREQVIRYIFEEQRKRRKNETGR